MFKRNYRIELKVIDENTEELIGQRSSSSQEVIEQSIVDIKTWIKNYEDLNVRNCDQCRFEFYIGELSVTNDRKYLICQDCIEKLIVDGSEQLKTEK